jgi:outer membrane protein TolC
MHRFPLAAFLLTVALFPAWSMDFDDLVSRLEFVAEVRQATLALSEAQSGAEEALLVADPRLSLSPVSKTTGTEDGEYLKTDLEAAVGLVVSIGQTDEEQERLLAARNAVIQAETSLATAFDTAFVQLHRYYQDLWLLQEEGRVLVLEQESAALNAEAALLRYEAGTENLSFVWSAEEEMREADEDLTLNALAQKLAWYSLTRYVGLETHGETIEVLSEYRLDQKELPSPSEAQARLLAGHPSLLALDLGLDLRREIHSRLLRPNLDLNLRPFVTWQDQTFSLGYTLSSKQINTTYSAPLATFGSLPVSGGTTQPTWNGGLSLVLSWTGEARDTAEASSLAIEMARETARRDDLATDLGLSLRAAYQRWRTAMEAVATAERALERVNRTLALVESRRTLGQALGSEVQAAQAEQARAGWRLKSAHIESEKAYLAYANAALLTAELRGSQ